jgi:hypothetical protein
LSAETLRQVLEAEAGLRASLQPATDEQAIVTLRHLSVHYPLAVRREAEETARWADWLEDLAEIPVSPHLVKAAIPSGHDHTYAAPADLIAEACRLWRRSDAEFFPTSGQLCRIISPGLSTRLIIADNLSILRALVQARLVGARA